MNWLNKVGFASPTLRSATGGDELRIESLKENKELIILRNELNVLNERIDTMNKIVTSKVEYCKVCNITWMDTLHNACPSCNSGESFEIGWIENWDEVDASLEPRNSEVTPAAGGGARRATQAGDSK